MSDEQNRKNSYLQSVTRRQFLRRSLSTFPAISLAPAFIPSHLFGQSAPSEKITIGCIGVGGHGTNMNLRSFLEEDDARVVAVCDVDSEHLKNAQDMVHAKYGNDDCAAYGDFREIIARDDIDTVMISTPDHWHTPISLMALRAGKDVICEKPTMTVEEGQVLSRAVRDYGRVFQTSTEDRSVFVYHRMAELVRNGRIGKLQTIKVTLPSQPTAAGDPTPMPVPDTLNYDLWLGPAPEAPYTKDRVHFNFRWLWDYSGGIITDWGTHLFDTAQWANDTEYSGPVKISGSGTFWEEGLYDTVKNFDLEYTYANGVKLLVSDGGTGIRCEGTDGWIDIPYWRGPLQASERSILDTTIGPEETHLFTCPEGEHRNFLNCVKSRKDPYFTVEKGHRVATVCHLGNIALLTHQDLTWDPENEIFPDNPEANRHLTRSMRSPWSL